MSKKGAPAAALCVELSRAGSGHCSSVSLVTTEGTLRNSLFTTQYNTFNTREHMFIKAFSLFSKNILLEGLSTDCNFT